MLLTMLELLLTDGVKDDKSGRIDYSTQVALQLLSERSEPQMYNFGTF